MIELRYLYRDEFGQETETRKTFTNAVLEDNEGIELSFDVFKRHLRNCGYTEEYINKQAAIFFQ